MTDYFDGDEELDIYTDMDYKVRMNGLCFVAVAVDCTSGAPRLCVFAGRALKDWRGSVGMEQRRCIALGVIIEKQYAARNA